MSVRKAMLQFAGQIAHKSGGFRFLHHRTFPDSVSVLMYHGLVSEALPVPDWCFVSCEQFAQQMQYLAAHFEVVHLEEAFAARRRVSERPLACITFDDGFASVSELALPILERLRLPATVYLVTDLIDSDETVWFAHLHHAISEANVSMVRLGDLRFQLNTASARAMASVNLQRALKRLPREEFAKELSTLLAELASGCEACARLPGPFRILRSHEIRRMSKDGLVRFGGHTASHQILTRTTRDDARREIERSVSAVASLVNDPSHSFAYPNGSAEDFDDSVIEAVRGAGIEYAVTTIEGPNSRDTNPYAIKRYGVGGEDSLKRFTGLIHHVRHIPRELKTRISARRISF